MHKSSLSPREYLRQLPDDEVVEVRHGAKHIPIHPLQDSLDFFEWSTENFVWNIYKDRYGSLAIAAALELVLYYRDDRDERVSVRFVGAANFSLDSLGPIENFMAAVKSLCIKNAAQDAGNKFGRGLNLEVMPEFKNERKQDAKIKVKPDKAILQQYADAIRDGDQQTIKTLVDIYDIKT